MEEAWEELWSELHHQGDVGEASYAAVTGLVELRDRGVPLVWNFHALCAWSLRGALALIALCKGHVRLGVWLSDLGESELEELTERELAWSSSYREDDSA